MRPRPVDRDGTLGQRLLFGVWRVMPDRGPASRWPAWTRTGLLWLGGAVALGGLAFVAPVGISEFAMDTPMARACTAIVGYTLGVVIVLRGSSRR